MFDKIPPVSRQSRHALVSRRAMLKRSLAVGAGAAALAACGNGDAGAFGDASVASDAGGEAASATSTASTTAPTSTVAPSTVAPSTVAPSTVAPSTAPASTAPASTAPPEQAGPPAIPDGMRFVSSFTYKQGVGGKNEPPYIAVWIEDDAGELVETIELWYVQGQKGQRWLPDLRRWFSVDRARIDAGGSNDIDVVSGATRLAGSYDVVWDGATNAGPIPTGSYFFCIESARERGPYSLIRVPVLFDGAPLDVVLPDDGELTAASVAVMA